MRKFMVANPKGGCGKSTMAIHLASWFARCDEVVYLGARIASNPVANGWNSAPNPSPGFGLGKLATTPWLCHPRIAVSPSSTHRPVCMANA